MSEENNASISESEEALYGEDIVVPFASPDFDAFEAVAASDGEREENGAESTDDEQEAHEHTCETFELEYEEDDILYYLVDETGREVGFALAGEDGEGLEYYYAEEDEESAEKTDKRKDAADKVAEFLSSENVATAAKDVNSIYREGKEAATEIKEVVDDLKGMLDFKNFFK